MSASPGLFSGLSVLLFSLLILRVYTRHSALHVLVFLRIPLSVCAPLSAYPSAVQCTSACESPCLSLSLHIRLLFSLHVAMNIYVGDLHVFSRVSSRLAAHTFPRVHASVPFIVHISFRGPMGVHFASLYVLSFYASCPLPLCMPLFVSRTCTYIRVSQSVSLCVSSLSTYDCVFVSLYFHARLYTYASAFSDHQDAHLSAIYSENFSAQFSSCGARLSSCRCVTSLLRMYMCVCILGRLLLCL